MNIFAVKNDILLKKDIDYAFHGKSKNSLKCTECLLVSHIVYLNALGCFNRRFGGIDMSLEVCRVSLCLALAVEWERPLAIVQTMVAG